MKIDENIDPKPVDANAEARKKEALIRENEKKEGIKKAVVTTSIIGFVVLLIAVIIACSLYNHDHKLLLSQMETQKNSFTDKIASRDSSIGAWVTTFGEIEQLNTEKSDLQSTVVQKDEKINTQTFEINKAFFACGTFKQLKAKGLLTKEGGFIGLGKTKTLAGSFPDSSFKQIDITVMKSIPVNSKSAKLISEHPANSYQFIRDKDKKIESIEITDPVQFWKISKYAVVEITK